MLSLGYRKEVDESRIPDLESISHPTTHRPLPHALTILVDEAAPTTSPSCKHHLASSGKMSQQDFQSSQGPVPGDCAQPVFDAGLVRTILIKEHAAWGNEQRACVRDDVGQFHQV